MAAILTPDEAAQLRPGEQLVIVRPGDFVEFKPRSFTPKYVAPQNWVALTGPCPDCGGVGSNMPNGMICRDCLGDGRRIVPLYTECPTCGGLGYWSDDVKDGKRWVTTERTCLNCLGECSCQTTVHYPDNPDCLANQGHTGRVLVGRAAVVSIEPDDDGRNWRIVIDCVEVL